MKNTVFNSHLIYVLRIKYILGATFIAVLTQAYLCPPSFLGEVFLYRHKACLQTFTIIGFVKFVIPILEVCPTENRRHSLHTKSGSKVGCTMGACVCKSQAAILIYHFCNLSFYLQYILPGQGHSYCSNHYMAARIV